MMFNALVMNHTYGIAATLDGMQTTVTMMKMWVLNVTDISIHLYNDVSFHWIKNIGLENLDLFLGVYVSFIEECATVELVKIVRSM